MKTSILENHPFAVEAYFKKSLVLTFAVPKEELLDLIPTCLELDTFKNNWAFVAVAMVDTINLRPKGFPEFMGNDFFLIGFRIFVRYKTQSGKNLRGLYIIKSETNKKKMEILGNIFTQYKYTTTDIHQRKENFINEISSSRSNFLVKYKDSHSEDIGLPAHSPFLNWKEARRFAGPLPFTFSYNPVSKTVLIIEGVRQNWMPKPIQVIEYNFSYLKELDLKDQYLANAFIIEDIPYSWKKGQIEIWKP